MRYIEPFCGSACLFFHVQPPRAVLGDLNCELIDTLRAVRNSPHHVLESIRRFRRGRAAYYELRKKAVASLAQAERAARFVYLNRMCFNGIYRTNCRGEFNVPYGPPKNGGTVDEWLILSAARVLDAALIVQGDFEKTLSHAAGNEFVYLDPPYYLDNRQVFREYGPGSFGCSSSL